VSTCSLHHVVSCPLCRDDWAWPVCFSDKPFRLGKASFSEPQRHGRSATRSVSVNDEIKDFAHLWLHVQLPHDHSSGFSDSWGDPAGNRCTHIPRHKKHMACPCQNLVYALYPDDFICMSMQRNIVSEWLWVCTSTSKRRQVDVFMHSHGADADD
jgi:hypothetical protein